MPVMREYVSPSDFLDGDISRRSYFSTDIIVELLCIHISTLSSSDARKITAGASINPVTLSSVFLLGVDKPTQNVYNLIIVNYALVVSIALCLCHMHHTTMTACSDEREQFNIHAQEFNVHD